MKKIFSLCITIILGSNIVLFAQHVNLTGNMSVVLCKKWKLDYVLDNGMKITPPPGEGFNYEFKQDNTFELTGQGQEGKGTWSYDPDKKLIKLKINNVSNTTIISLKETELIMLLDTKTAMPDAPAGMKTFFVPSN